MPTLTRAQRKKASVRSWWRKCHGAQLSPWPAWSQKKPAKWRAKFLLYEASERQNGGRRRIAPPRGLLLASLGRPPIADRLLTRGLRLDPLARKGGPDEHLPSTARIHRWARWRWHTRARGSAAWASAAERAIARGLEASRPPYPSQPTKSTMMMGLGLLRIYVVRPLPATRAARLGVKR